MGTSQRERSRTSALTTQYNIVEDDQPHVFFATNAATTLEYIAQPFEGRLPSDSLGSPSWRRIWFWGVTRLSGGQHSLLDKNTRWLGGGELFYFVQPFDPCEDITRLVALFFLNFFILDTTDDILDLCNHLKGTLIFKRRWIGVKKQVLKH